jgi:hypothetical protein
MGCHFVRLLVGTYVQFLNVTFLVAMLLFLLPVVTIYFFLMSQLSYAIALFLTAHRAPWHFFRQLLFLEGVATARSNDLADEVSEPPDLVLVLVDSSPAARSGSGPG